MQFPYMGVTRTNWGQSKSPLSRSPFLSFVALCALKKTKHFSPPPLLLQELYTPRRVWNARSSGARLGLACGLGARGWRPREESDLSSAMSFRESSVRLSPSRSLGKRFATARPFLPRRSLFRGVCFRPSQDRSGLTSRFLPHLSFDSVHYALVDAKRISQSRGGSSGESCPLCTRPA